MQGELPQASEQGRGSFWACLAKPGLVAQLSEPERHTERDSRDERA
ncbi:hypothetical protein K3148_11025 [Qipengyuania aurantiaca]|uniref:Uncharacterized protein n=1 Tax=Qipengyuania aurantiaca TaxID=2867233 RepID=A0ABX8ZK63_9SPHN|nr:hypothetical protein [Qipengyuania aurantiaca]QZD89342.1 hypothetical protein K3148_11025 [Qipengyuania aurantiaca]